MSTLSRLEVFDWVERAYIHFLGQAPVRGVMGVKILLAICKSSLIPDQSAIIRYTAVSALLVVHFEVK